MPKRIERPELSADMPADSPEPVALLTGPRKNGSHYVKDPKTGRWAPGPSHRTGQQEIFAVEYARNGGRGTEAARRAGYSERMAGRYAYQLLEKPNVQVLIRKEQRRLLTGLASLALAQAKLMLEDPETPAGARASLITAVLDRAGLAPVKEQKDEEIDGRDLREMSLQELEALWRDRCKVIEGGQAESLLTTIGEEHPEESSGSDSHAP
ncbi:terminase small subunit [Vineibacter terrae]|nr:terminase small subunit [Vineibacter terrae]